MSGNYCTPLKDGASDAHQICQQLRKDGVTLSEIDHGTKRSDYDRFGLNQVEVTDQSRLSTGFDLRAQAAEIYNYVLAHSQVAATLALPWQPRNSTGDAARDQALAALLQNPPGTARERARALYAILCPLLQTASDVTAYRYASYCKRLGIDARPIEMTLSNRILIGLSLDSQDPTQLTFVDFSRAQQGFDIPLYPGEWVALSERELLAYHYLQQGPQGLQMALEIAPQNYRVIYETARQLMSQGDTEAACQQLRESLSLNVIFASASRMVAHDCAQPPPVTK